MKKYLQVTSYVVIAIFMLGLSALVMDNELDTYTFFGGVLIISQAVMTLSYIHDNEPRRKYNKNNK